MRGDCGLNFSQFFWDLLLHEFLIIFSEVHFVVLGDELDDFAQNEGQFFGEKVHRGQAGGRLCENLVVVVVLAKQGEEVAFLLLCKVRVRVNELLHLRLHDPLSDHRLVTRNRIARVYTILHPYGFFHFAHRFDHGLNVVVDDLVLETRVFAVSVVSSLHSFGFVRDQEVRFPSGFEHGVFFAEV